MSQIATSSSLQPPDLSSIIGERIEHGFFRRAAGSLAYPFRHGGLSRWLIGGLLIGLGVLAATLGARSLFLSGPIIGYLATYLLHIANASGDGSDEIPGWPGFNPELVSNFTMFFLTVLFTQLPIIAYVAAIFFWHAPIRFVILPAYLSMFILPMAVMRVSMLQTLESLNPIHLVRSIFRVPTAYLGLCLILTFLGAVQAVLGVVFQLIPYAGLLLKALLDFYMLILVMRLLGLFYYVHRHTLDWFSGIAPAATESADHGVG